MARTRKPVHKTTTLQTENHKFRLLPATFTFEKNPPDILYTTTTLNKRKCWFSGQERRFKRTLSL